MPTAIADLKKIENSRKRGFVNNDLREANVCL